MRCSLLALGSIGCASDGSPHECACEQYEDGAPPPGAHLEERRRAMATAG
ncbi:MAG: hypothetical protein ACXVEE_31325 [Polyangiales bacterium]